MSEKSIPLRYGMNPHQTPARLYMDNAHEYDTLPLRVLNGTPGYINFLDALNGWQLVRELRAALDLPAAASFKHVSPAGAAVGVPLSATQRQAYMAGDSELSPLATAYARARGTDRVSSFGDWVALSDVVDLSTANLLRREVSDGIIAPGYTKEALEILRRKKQGGYRILEIDPSYVAPATETRTVFGFTLEQRRNDHAITQALLDEVVTTGTTLPATARSDLLVATITLKYTQSNSICLALDGQTIGVGAGQQSRIHCTRLTATKAQTWYLRQHPKILMLPFCKGVSRPVKDNAIDQYILTGHLSSHDNSGQKILDSEPPPLSDSDKQEWLNALQNVALSSDGFIPFRDNIDEAFQWGVKYVAQPGGSLRDDEVIAACNEHGMTMVFSGLRLFHH